MFSSAVSIGSRLKNWKMKPMWRRRSLVSSLSPSPVISVPPSETLPLVGRSRPARMCISVDLPEPEGPMIAVRLPLLEPEADAAQRVDGGRVLAVAPGDVGGDDDLSVGIGDGSHRIVSSH